jgi:S-DNA-T family DNA segregation ATPase FtsK/SpoIIIE
MVSDNEIQRLVDFWRVQVGQVSSPTQSDWKVQVQETSIDPLLSEAVALIRREGRVSASMLQRRLRIGYTRASRLIDQMEKEGIVSPPDSRTGIRNVCS